MNRWGWEVGIGVSVPLIEKWLHASPNQGTAMVKAKNVLKRFENNTVIKI